MFLPEPTRQRLHPLFQSIETMQEPIYLLQRATI